MTESNICARSGLWRFSKAVQS